MRVFKDESTRGKWYIDYSFRGKRIRFDAGSSKEVAGKLRTRIETEINQGKHDPVKLRDELNGKSGGGMTLGQLTKLFLELYRSRGLSGYYANRIKVHLKYFGESRPVMEIGPLQVEAFRNWSAAQGHGPATIRKNLISLGTIFRWAIGKGLVTENPADPILVKRPSEPPAREVYLDREQVRLLLLECEPDLRRLVHFLINTGMSLGDPLKLTWSKMDAKSGWIYATRGKTGRAYKIPYTDVLQAIVGSRPRHLKSEFVFCNRDGTQVNANKMSKDIKKALERIGVHDASAHSLRHTFASRLIESGASLKAVADLLGQSQTSVTQRYTHLTPESLRGTMQNMHAGERHEEGGPSEPSGENEPEPGKIPGGG